MIPYMWCRYCDKLKAECKCARPSIVLSENDHLAAVSAARADALRWVLDRIDSTIERPAAAIYKTRLRAIIEKELSQ